MREKRKVKKIKPLRNVHPSWKAVLWFLIPVLAVQIFTLVSGIIWLFLFKFLLYLTSGYVAGRLYYSSFKMKFPRGNIKEQVRSGAAVGIALSIISLITSFVLILLIPFLGIFSLLLIGEFGFAYWIPVDFLAGLLLGALGGRLSI